MNDIRQRLLDKLIELETAAAGRSGLPGKPDLMSLFREIDDLSGELPEAADPALLHYLTRKSYQKARMLLQGRDSENETGDCLRSNPRSAR